MENLTQQEVKGYQLYQILGEGAFGVVYRAYQSQVNRDFVIADFFGNSKCDLPPGTAKQSVGIRSSALHFAVPFVTSTHQLQGGFTNLMDQSTVAVTVALIGLVG